MNITKVVSSMLKYARTTTQAGNGSGEVNKHTNIGGGASEKPRTTGATQNPNWTAADEAALQEAHSAVHVPKEGRGGLFDSINFSSLYHPQQSSQAQTYPIMTSSVGSGTQSDRVWEQMHPQQQTAPITANKSVTDDELHGFASNLKPRVPAQAVGWQR